MVRRTRDRSIFPIILLVPALCYSQLPSSRCDSSGSPLADCSFLTGLESAPTATFTSTTSPFVRRAVVAETDRDSVEDETDSGQTTATTATPLRKEGFHWRRALAESATFLVIEQAYVVHTDFNWVVSENGVPFNHYWRDYRQSLSEWVHSGWNDGDPNWFGYVGHPIQGALTGFVQIQNDPQGETIEFSRPKRTGGVA